MNPQVEDFRKALDQYEKLIGEWERINFYSPTFNPYETPPFAAEPGDDELKSVSGHRTRDIKNRGDIRDLLPRMATTAGTIKALADKVHLRLECKAEYDSLLNFLDPSRNPPSVDVAKQQIKHARRLLHYLGDDAKPAEESKPIDVDDDATLSPKNLAVKWGISHKLGALQSRLKRFRESNPAGNGTLWIEITDAAPRDAKFWFRVRYVRPIMDALKTTSERRARKLLTR